MPQDLNFPLPMKNFSPFVAHMMLINIYRMIPKTRDAQIYFPQKQSLQQRKMSIQSEDQQRGKY